MNGNPYYVYILKCKDGTLYTGITTNIERRFNEHKKGKGGHYTGAKGALKIVFTEEYLNRSEAAKRESEIKKWTREKKLSLINMRLTRI